MKKLNLEEVFDRNPCTTALLLGKPPMQDVFKELREGYRDFATAALLEDSPLEFMETLLIQKRGIEEVIEINKKYI